MRNNSLYQNKLCVGIFDQTSDPKKYFDMYSPEITTYYAYVCKLLSTVGTVVSRQWNIGKIIFKFPVQTKIPSFILNVSAIARVAHTIIYIDILRMSSNNNGISGI